MQLNVEQELEELLSPQGPLASHLKGYESRPQQVSMALDVAHAYTKEGIALIEAGTGIGKSVAYLLPALLWACIHKERTIISTHTITLQEQLLCKDLPLLLKALGLETKAVLVKGMQNYLCLRKMEAALEERRLLSEEMVNQLEQVQEWSEESEKGSRSELSFAPLPQVWEKVSCEADACSHARCPHYKACFFFKARRAALDASLLFVNHHLLCADLLSRQEVVEGQQGGIFPPYSRVIVDEAHHLEDVATEHLAQRISFFDIMHQIGRLGGEKRAAGHQQSLLAILRHKLIETFILEENHTVKVLTQQLEIDIPAQRLQLQQSAHETFSTLFDFLQECQTHNNEEKEESSFEKKLRLLPQMQSSKAWQANITPLLQNLKEALLQLGASLINVEGKMKQIDHELFQDHAKSVCLDLMGVASRLTKMATVLGDFANEKNVESLVRWIEIKSAHGAVNVQLASARLHVAPLLQDLLFDANATVVLCSATLTTNGQFNFIKHRLGLDLDPERLLIERHYDSPFDYEKQVLLAVPTDMPAPTSPQYLAAAIDQIESTIKACKGQAFVLFTSFSMMRHCYNVLSSKFKTMKCPAMIQGQEGRMALLNRFKKTKGAVLFGTDSFWEGVDVVGDALRCVILVKLPFKVPTEPLIEAKVEAIVKEGGDPFMDFTIPTAIVKFKQGFGRLIRNKEDRGCIVCLDPRLITKGYGKLFLKSLPSCRRVFDTREVLKEEISAFYSKNEKKGSCN